ncbi:MAG: penicillin-binding protein 2 [Anaerolineae bacterium]
MGDWFVRSRFALFRLAILVCFAALGFRMWELQIVSSATYQSAADNNRFRLIPVDAPRGIIYDRYGNLLVRNVPSFSVSVVPAGLPEERTPERQAVIKRVSELLGMPVEPGDSGVFAAADSAIQVRGSKGPTIEEIVEQTMSSRYAPSPYAPLRIASNVDRQAAFILEEEHLDLPGVVVEAEPQRQYLEGPLMAHILGYMGRIPAENLDRYKEDPDYTYEPDDLVGLLGIERTQEDLLRGIKGEKHVEVDAFEREVAVIASEDPIQSSNIVLTIDLEFQRYVEEVLREGMRNAGSKVGVAIALDPRTGEVLAMVSLPSYDNNLFSGGISYEDYVSLSSDSRRPLVNHAIGGQYPPGSTFKIVPAAAGLQEGTINRNTTFTCGGIMYLPNRFFPGNNAYSQPFYCWRLGGHGSLNVIGALQNSCDIFFYQATGGFGQYEGLGMDRLASYMSMFGFGEPTGVELVGESSGLVPNDRWKRLNYSERWTTGDTYNASIGQGFVLATPLQLVNATSVIANSGTLYRPQLIYQVLGVDGQVIEALEPEVIREVSVSQENLSYVREGMRLAVESGTAPGARIPGITVAGKTGSAEYPALDEEGNLIVDEHGYLPTHAWFTAFAPYEDPEIAVVVFLEGGGEGSRTAVPVAAKILRRFFGVSEPESVPTKAAPPEQAEPIGD